LPQADGVIKLHGMSVFADYLTAIRKEHAAGDATEHTHRPALTVASARELAQRMAGMTRIIRDLIVNPFEHEKEQGWLHNVRVHSGKLILSGLQGARWI
jgi:hypothetical protein